MKKIALFLTLTIGLFSCTKEEQDQNTPNEPVDRFSDLLIPSDFNWSSSMKGLLSVNITAPSYVALENQEVQLVTEDGEVLAFRKIKNGKVDFRLALPDEHGRIFVFMPTTYSYAEVTSGGTLDLKVPDFLAEDPLSDATQLPFTTEGGIKKAVTSSNALINGDFESPVDSTYDGTLASLIGNWQMLTDRKNAVIKTINGSKVLASDNNEYIQFAQVIKNEFRRRYNFHFDFAGSSNGRLYLYKDDGKLIGYVKPRRNPSTGTADVTITLAPSVSYVEARIYTKGKDGWLDDVELNLVAEPDDDNDGIINRIDDFPDDATKAFASYYPLQGRQALAFEDLWPSKGDYDFNDVVLSNLVTFGADKNGELVDARFQVKVNAMGAGLPNGIGIKFYKPDGSEFTQNVIDKFTGEGYLDPNVQNGIIVTDNVKNIKPSYWNTGVGPDASPKEFDFTITFNANMDEDYLVPDIYIFRTNERGREIHLPGFSGTSAADATLYGTGADVNGTYLTEDHHPWVIEILYPATIFFNHPMEKVDITKAYPYFQTWAESGGNRYKGWMVLPSDGKVYTKLK